MAKALSAGSLTRPGSMGQPQSESVDWDCRDGLRLEKRSPAPVAEKRDVQT